MIMIFDMRSIWNILAILHILFAILFGSSSAYASDSYANEQISKTCLDFSLSNFETDRQKIFNFFKISTQKRSQYKVYLSKSDLNNDGDHEIFSYIDGVGFCGNQTGCYIEIYRYKNNKLIKLTKHGLPTFFPFNIKENLNNQYICISENTENKWHNIIMEGKFEMSFDGKFYSRVNSN